VDTIDSLLKDYKHCYLEYNGEVLTSLEALEDGSNIYVCINFMKKYKRVALKDVSGEHRVEELCLAAVKHNGRDLEYVINQTEEIRLEAVKQTGYALQYISDRTGAICLATVEYNGHNLNYVRNQTRELCIVAIK
jgi:hypothetical protein